MSTYSRGGEMGRCADPRYPERTCVTTRAFWRGRRRMRSSEECSGAAVRGGGPTPPRCSSGFQRSSLSVQLNIAEGYSLPRRFRSHLEIAYGSAVETGDLLELALEEGVIPPADV